MKTKIKYVEKEKEIRPKFSFLETIKITEGFYKGYFGNIKEYEVSEEHEIVYIVKLVIINKEIEIKESIIKKVSLLDLMFNKEIR